MHVVHCKIYYDNFGVRQSLLTHVQKQRLLHSREYSHFYQDLFNNAVDSTWHVHKSHLAAFA